jgi:hypothetical protein
VVRAGLHFNDYIAMADSLLKNRDTGGNVGRLLLVSFPAKGA